MNVVIMCSRGYGSSFSAINTKSELIALGLIAAGVDVHIIDSVKGIRAINCCQEKISQAGVPYAAFPEGRGKRLLSNIKEYKSLLLKYKKSADINHIIIGMEYMPIFILLIRCAKRCGYTTSTLFHEWHIGMPTKGIKSLHKYWQDYCFGKYVDAILPISHFLQAKSERFGKPTLLLPVLGRYDMLLKQDVDQQFTYCADAGYLLRNQLILQAFKIVSETYSDVRLNLVLFGTKDDWQKVYDCVADLHIHEKVMILSQISNNELEHLYASSLGLLMPLNPDSMQDVARFSQKIAEYLASGRPIITSNVGEISYYFAQDKNVMIAEYSPQMYADRMMVLINNPQMAGEIGRNGYDVGMRHFDYRKNGEKLRRFLCSEFKFSK